MPRIPIIYRRDAHPSAKLLRHLTDPLLANEVLASEIVEFGEALERTWPQDAHFAGYHLEDDEGSLAFSRVSKRSPFVRQLEAAGGRVAVTVAALDYDNPEHGEWSGDMLGDFIDGLEAGTSQGLPAPTAWYTTLHGARLVYVLDSPAQPSEAEEIVAGLISRWASVGLQFDLRCCDWTRLFRLPRTVREDSGDAYEPDVLVTDGPLLERATAPRAEVIEAAAYVETDAEVGDCPSQERVLELTESWDVEGKQHMTDLVKRARRALKVTGPDPDPPYPYNILFEHNPLVEGDENWNSTVLQVIGSVVGRLTRVEDATAEEIYALLHGPLTQLQERERSGANKTDWLATGWDMVSRMWLQETARIAAEVEQQAVADAERAERVLGLREGLLEHMHATGQAPTDDVDALEWLDRRLLAVVDRKIFVMRRDGEYNKNSTSRENLPLMIRQLGMGELIPLYKMQGKALVPRMPSDIIAEHGLLINELRYSVGATSPTVSGDEGALELTLPLYALNPNLRAEFSRDVDRWLNEFVEPEDYDQLVEWLSHVLDYLRPICALNLWGASEAGKTLLLRGLADCFSTTSYNDGRVLGKWNGGLLDSPIISCEEGVPRIANDEGLPLDQAFRDYITRGRLTIRRMRENPFTAELYPRIIFTSNDDVVLGQIAGSRDLTRADRVAIQRRLMSLCVQESARHHLARLGNMAHTATWCSPGGLELANHIYFLFKNRTRAQATGTESLLVQGSTSTVALEEAQLDTTDASIVAQALIKFIEADVQVSDRGMVFAEGQLHVTAAGIAAFAALHVRNGDRLTLNMYGRLIKNQFTGDERQKPSPHKPPGWTGGIQRFKTIDLRNLYKFALRNGLPCDKLRETLLKQPKGVQTVAEAERER